MKKLIALLLAAAFLNVSIAVTPSVDDVTAKKATAIMIPIGKTGNKISLADFSKLKSREYEKLANVKLGFMGRIQYNRAMKKLRNSIAADGTITNKKMVKAIGSADDLTGDFHLGGLALGGLLSVIGVLIAYLINDDKKSQRIKWAWIGLALSILLFLIIF
ncbi:MAG: hypothetical protein RL172_97 [Bacteroidota bacterium]|jgi:hypothetical protein